MDTRPYDLRDNDLFGTSNARDLHRKIHEKRTARNMGNSLDRIWHHRHPFDMWFCNGPHDGHDKALEVA